MSRATPPIRIEAVTHGDGVQAVAVITIETTQGHRVVLQVQFDEDYPRHALEFVVSAVSSPVAITVNPGDITSGGRHL